MKIGHAIKSIGRCVGPDSICGPSLVLIGQKLRPVPCNTQTNKQTNKQMKERSESADMPKFNKC